MFTKGNKIAINKKEAVEKAMEEINYGMGEEKTLFEINLL